MKDEFKFLLTIIFLATRYPEAIPLKDIRAVSVAEGMCEIFSRCGVVRQILTDQGSQFVVKLVTQLCWRLNIDKLTTIPYHPESNRCLEQFHGINVPMLRKGLTDKLDWESQVKLSLFVCCCAPTPIETQGLTPLS